LQKDYIFNAKWKKLKQDWTNTYGLSGCSKPGVWLRMPVKKGKVKYKGIAAKAAKIVAVDDEYEIKTPDKKWLIKVSAVLNNRVQYKEAIKFYQDITPAEEIERIAFQAAVFNTGKRMSKQGRPTKKDKRELDEFMGD
jgi:ribosome-associated heat shock protein Hsp15